MKCNGTWSGFYQAELNEAVQNKSVKCLVLDAWWLETRKEKKREEKRRKEKGETVRKEEGKRKYVVQRYGWSVFMLVVSVVTSVLEYVKRNERWIGGWLFLWLVLTELQKVGN